MSDQNEILKDLAVRPTVTLTTPNIPSDNVINSLWRIAQFAANSSITKFSGPSAPYDCFFLVTLGWELGISPMVALRYLYVVNGVPTTSGQAMLALILASEFCEKVEMPDFDSIVDSATVVVQRRGSKPYKATYTMADAAKAGLSNKDNWMKHPKQMLMWRALSIGARVEFPDVIGGLYTVEEINPNLSVNPDTGEIIEAEFSEAKHTPSAQSNGKATDTIHVPSPMAESSPSPEPETPQTPAQPAKPESSKPTGSAKPLGGDSGAKWTAIRDYAQKYFGTNNYHYRGALSKLREITPGFDDLPQEEIERLIDDRYWAMDTNERTQFIMQAMRYIKPASKVQVSLPEMEEALTARMEDGKPVGEDLSKWRGSRAEAYGAIIAYLMGYEWVEERVSVDRALPYRDAAMEIAQSICALLTPDTGKSKPKRGKQKTAEESKVTS